ncbi:MAG: Gfo/Idh/MocA family oxidoreductase [Thermoguttaceae bacterium]|nr:Gfo/Idh/MocA family oxidoreductase [Thermoguttaceae bacterium]
MTRTGTRIGIGVIGTGRAGMIHARNFASGVVPGAEIVAIAEPMEASRTAAAQELGVDADSVYADYRELLENPRVNAVIVVTPTKFHREIVVAAAAAGKHILCEKPMAMNVTECDAMLDAVRAARVKLQIGFMRRFDVGFQAAKQRIESGEIGRVVQVKSLTHGPTTPKPWMYDLQQSNGPLAEVNSHDIDAIRWFTGGEFQEVYAIAGNYRSPDAVRGYPDFYDNVLLTARMSNEMQGMIGGAQGVKYGYDSRCEILGEHGLITVGSLSGNTVVSYMPNGAEHDIVHSWMNLFIDAYRAEDIDFVRCIREDDTPRATGVDGRAAVMVVNAGNQSIVERRPVTLPH